MLEARGRLESWRGGSGWWGPNGGKHRLFSTLFVVWSGLDSSPIPHSQVASGSAASGLSLENRRDEKFQQYQKPISEARFSRSSERSSGTRGEKREEL